jgi:hypothetical protein
MRNSPISPPRTMRAIGGSRPDAGTMSACAWGISTKGAETITISYSDLVGFHYYKNGRIKAPFRFTAPTKRCGTIQLPIGEASW